MYLIEFVLEKFINAVKNLLFANDIRKKVFVDEKNED